MGFLYDMYYICAMQDLMHKHNLQKRSINSRNENRNKGNEKEESGAEKEEINEKKAVKVEVQGTKDKDQEAEGKSERSINGDSSLKDEVHEELLVRHDTAAFIRQLEATKKEVLKAIDQISEATAEELRVRSDGRSKDGGDSQKREGSRQSKGEDQGKEVEVKVKKCDNDDDTCNWVKKDKENGGQEYRDKKDGNKFKKERESKGTKTEEMNDKANAVGGKREKIDLKKDNGMEKRKKEGIIVKKKGAEDNDFDYREMNHEEIKEAYESGLKLNERKENKAEKKSIRKTKTKEEDNGENRVEKHHDGRKSKAKKENNGMTKTEADEDGDDGYREMYHDGDDKSSGLQGGKSKIGAKDKGESTIRENREEIILRKEEMKRKWTADLQQKKRSGSRKKEVTEGKTEREETQSDNDEDVNDDVESKRSKMKRKHEKIEEDFAKEKVHKSKTKAKHHEKHHEKHLKENGSGCQGSKKCGTGKHVKIDGKEEGMENKIADKKVDDMTKKYAEIERLLKELNTLIRSTKHNGHTPKHAGLGHKSDHEVHHAKNLHKSHESIANSEEKHQKTKGEKTNAKTERSHGRIDVTKHKPTKGVEGANHKMKHTPHENKGQATAHEGSKNKLPRKVTTKKKMKKIDKGKKEKRAHTDQKNSIFPITSKYFNKCKLAAYLYYIAVRGFGQRYYRNEPPGWCERFCVQESGVPNLKKYRRPRNIM